MEKDQYYHATVTARQPCASAADPSSFSIQAAKRTHAGSSYPLWTSLTPSCPDGTEGKLVRFLGCPLSIRQTTLCCNSVAMSLQMFSYSFRSSKEGEKRRNNRSICTVVIPNGEGQPPSPALPWIPAEQRLAQWHPGGFPCTDTCSLPKAWQKVSG